MKTHISGSPLLCADPADQLEKAKGIYRYIFIGVSANVVFIFLEPTCHRLFDVGWQRLTRWLAELTIMRSRSPLLLWQHSCLHSLEHPTASSWMSYKAVFNTSRNLSRIGKYPQQLEFR
jgi:hypothetical protein